MKRPTPRKINLIPSVNLNDSSSTIEKKLDILRKSIAEENLSTSKKGFRSSGSRLSKHLEKKREENKRPRIGQKLIRNNFTSIKADLKSRALKLPNALPQAVDLSVPIFNFEEPKARIKLRKHILNLREKTNSTSISTASSKRNQHQYAPLDENDSIDDEEEESRTNRVRTEDSFLEADDDNEIYWSCPEREFNKQKESIAAEDLLSQAGLEKFISVFHDNGFSDVETIKEIKPEHLQGMNIPKGFQIKLTKYLKAMGFQQSMIELESVEEKQDRRVTFKEAINEEPVQESNPKSWSIQIEDPTSTSTSTNNKIACYTCFRVIKEIPIISQFAKNRDFCSSSCMKVFLIGNSILCNNQECEVGVFIKKEGEFLKGKWYCSHRCASLNYDNSEPESMEEHNLDSITIPIDNELREVDLDFSDI